MMIIELSVTYLYMNIRLLSDKSILVERYYSLHTYKYSDITNRTSGCDLLLPRTAIAALIIAHQTNDHSILKVIKEIQYKERK